MTDKTFVSLMKSFLVASLILLLFVVNDRWQVSGEQQDKEESGEKDEIKHIEESISADNRSVVLLRSQNLLPQLRMCFGKGKRRGERLYYLSAKEHIAIGQRVNKRSYIHSGRLVLSSYVDWRRPRRICAQFLENENTANARHMIQSVSIDSRNKSFVEQQLDYALAVRDVVESLDRDAGSRKCVLDAQLLEDVDDIWDARRHLGHTGLYYDEAELPAATYGSFVALGERVKSTSSLYALVDVKLASHRLFIRAHLLVGMHRFKLSMRDDTDDEGDASDDGVAAAADDNSDDDDAATASDDGGDDAFVSHLYFGHQAVLSVEMLVADVPGVPTVSGAEQGAGIAFNAAGVAGLYSAEALGTIGRLRRMIGVLDGDVDVGGSGLQLFDFNATDVQFNATLYDLDERTSVVPNAKRLANGTAVADVLALVAEWRAAKLASVEWKRSRPIAARVSSGAGKLLRFEATQCVVSDMPNTSTLVLAGRLMMFALFVAIMFLVFGIYLMIGSLVGYLAMDGRISLPSRCEIYSVPVLFQCVYLNIWPFRRNNNNNNGNVFNHHFHHD
jgi:hypothetical protein